MMNNRTESAFFIFPLGACASHFPKFDWLCGQLSSLANTQWRFIDSPYGGHLKFTNHNSCPAPHMIWCETLIVGKPSLSYQAKLRSDFFITQLATDPRSVRSYTKFAFEAAKRYQNLGEKRSQRRKGRLMSALSTSIQYFATTNALPSLIVQNL